MVEQTYDGSVIIGNNGSNGSTRTLLSLDPLIHFKGTVDDAVANTHTLIARAVSVETGPNQIADVPRLIFEGKVGGASPLYALQAITGVQSAAGMPGDIDIATTIASPFTMIGQIVIKDSVTTLQDQTYVANAIDIGGGTNKLILTTDNGVINIYAGQNFNHPILPGVKAIDGAQIAIKGKFGKETAASFKASGVKFAQDNVGGFVDAALANLQSKTINKPEVDKTAKVTVGAAMKSKGGKLSTFDDGEDDKSSRKMNEQKADCGGKAVDLCPSK
jgi:hypothetical protein